MSEWISVEKSLPKWSDIIKVRRVNGDEIKAYYHDDRMTWLCYYNVKTSYFQDHKTKAWLHDVTHWLKKDES